MYIPEAIFQVQEQEIIFRIRQLISDTKEIFIDSFDNATACGNLTASGTIYALQEPKGYPKEIYVDGVEISGSPGAQVMGYKYIRFQPGTIGLNSSLVIIYDHFDNSDLEILDTYDSSALTYLTSQCSLTFTDLGPELLLLATAYILMSKKLQNYINAAVSLEDSDSKFDASRRPNTLLDLMKLISGQLKESIEVRLKCKIMSLPVYKVE